MNAEDVERLQERVGGLAKENRALRSREKWLDGERAALIEARDTYKSHAGMWKGQRDALAAHAERVRGIRNAIEERCEYLGRPTYYRSVEKEERYEREVEALRDELEEALDEAPATSFARRDAHPDNVAVDRFSLAMKAKLAKAREKGRDGWDDPDRCSVEMLCDLLLEHLEKGNYVDIANLAMMLHLRHASPELLRAEIACLKARWQAEALASLRADWQAKGVLNPQESLMLMNREQELRRQAGEEA